MLHSETTTETIGIVIWFKNWSYEGILKQWGNHWNNYFEIKKEKSKIYNNWTFKRSKRLIYHKSNTPFISYYQRAINNNKSIPKLSFNFSRED